MRTASPSDVQSVMHSPVQGRVMEPSVSSPSTVPGHNEASPTRYSGGAKKWSLDIKRKIADVSEFGDVWDVKTPITAGASARLNRWYFDQSMLTQITTPAQVVVILYGDQATGYPRWEGFVQIGTAAINTARDGIIDEDIDVEFDGEVYATIA